MLRLPPLSKPAPRFTGRRQEGIIVIITLICLVVLLLSSIALVRSFTNANIVAGAVAIKRDMVNQAQRGLAAATSNFQNLMPATANRLTANPQANYSPCMLPTDAYGIPIIIEDSDANFAGTQDLDGSHDPACAANPISTGAGNDVVDNVTNVTVRYVIDRMCVTTASPGATNCVVSNPGQATAGTQWVPRPAGVAPPIYRVTVRVKVGNLSSYVQGVYS
jgi:type IV pilus assembly protein PilX